MTQAEFDGAMPAEFWREVVDRVADGGARHAAAGRGVLAARGLLRAHARACTASTTARSCTCSATRTTRATGGCSGDARVRPRDPQALRQLHEQPRREDRPSSSSGRATSTSASRRCSRRCRGCRCSGTASSRASREKYGMEFRRATLDERRRRVARGAPRARDRPPAPPARGLRRRRATSSCTTSRPTTAGSTRTCSPTPTARLLAVAGRGPQPVRRDVGLDPRLGRVRGQGRRRVEAAGATDPGAGARAGRG